MFETLGIKRCYRSKKDNLDTDFFIPLLSSSIQYDRGTGYFSLEALIELSKGIIPYVKKGGKVRIITSVCLSEQDAELISKAHEKANEIIEVKLLEEINKELDEAKVLSLDLITNLIAAEIIQLKIAYLTNGGIYHEKVGYLEDELGNSVWFNGSTNETHSGLKVNAESLMVLKSWAGDSEDILEEKLYFDMLWKGKDEDIHVEPFPAVAEKQLLKLYKRSNSYAEVIKKIEEGYNSSSASGKELYKYQEEAIDEFFENGGCHFYEMATGTGKTYTAVKTLQAFKSRGISNKLYVVVLVPQIDLQEQWRRELEENEIKCHLFGGPAGAKDCDDEISKSIIDYYTKDEIVVSVCVYDTYFSKVSAKINNLSIDKMIVVDEAHELSVNQMSQLSESYIYRLGVSATPERHNPNETQRIITYFTRDAKEPYKYTIDEAIEKGFLSHYEYHPIYVHLDEEEFKAFNALSKQLAGLLNQKVRDYKKINDIANRRSLIVKKANDKVDVFRGLVASDKYDFRNSVVYCGQGKDSETEEKIIDQVTKCLNNIGNYSVSQFTSKTENRVQVLREFESGYFDTLVAIKCFDQGVDVPKLDKIYIMASDSLLRQTIQRRGRVLRKCKESGKTIAHIYDMIALPPEGIYNAAGADTLVAKELVRMKEYARLSDNYDENKQEIDALISNYNITEDAYGEEEIY